MGQYNDQRMLEKVQYPDIGIINELPTQTIAHVRSNLPPTPPLSQHFALSEMQVLMLAWGGGGGDRWAVSQKGKMIHF